MSADNTALIILAAGFGTLLNAADAEVGAGEAGLGSTVFGGLPA